MRLSENKVHFSEHALKGMELRTFTKENILQYLEKKPVDVEKQKDKESGKYRLYYTYELSEEKDLIVVMGNKTNRLNIITVYIQDRRRRKNG